MRTRTWRWCVHTAAATIESKVRRRREGPFQRVRRSLIRREAKRRSLIHRSRNGERRQQGIGPTSEWLLLRGLEEGSGIAARALESLQVSVKALRTAVLENAPGGNEAGADEVTPPLAPQAMRLLADGAPTAALALGHNYVGTEHLLLALCTVREATIERTLGSLGISGDDVRARVLALLTSAAK